MCVCACVRASAPTHRLQSELPCAHRHTLGRFDGIVLFVLCLAFVIQARFALNLNTTGSFFFFAGQSAYFS